MRGKDRNLAKFSEKSPVKSTNLRTSFHTWMTARLNAILDIFSLPQHFTGYALIFYNRARVISDASLDDAREQDVVLLGSTLTTVGFVVTIYTDLTVSQMCRTVKKFARMNHRAADHFFCAVISHGENYVAYGSDGEIPVDVLLEPLMISPALRDKQLLLVLELCRGGTFLDDGPKRSSGNSPRYDDWQNYYASAVATLKPGGEWRAADLGSCFIQSMCRLWLEPSATDIRRFDDLLTRVRFDLSSNSINHVHAPKNAIRWISSGGSEFLHVPTPVTVSRGSWGKAFPILNKA